jgi:hypothetical protein
MTALLIELLVKLGLIVLLTSQHSVIFMGISEGRVYQNVPLTPDSIRQRIIDELAATDSQATRRLRHSSMQRFQLCINLTINTFASVQKLFIQVDISDI